MMLAVVAIAAFALAGTLAGTLLYAVTRLGKEHERNNSLQIEAINWREKAHASELTVAAFKESNKDIDAALAAKTSEVLREIDARLRAEKNRDELLEEMAKTGDPRGVADRIRNELRAFSKMSSRTAKTSTDSGSTGSVSGTITPTTGTKLPPKP